MKGKAADKGNGSNALPLFRWPVKIPIRITSTFTEMRGSKPHAAIDIATPVGTPLFAMADGEIVAAWNDNTYGGGLSLRMKHPNGYTTGFAHLQRNNVLRVGAKVKAGDLIGYTGNTGTSTGPHLHLKIRNAQGVAINPVNVLPNV